MSGERHRAPLVAALAAGAAQAAAQRLLRGRLAGDTRWERQNYAGRTVSLTGGAATAFGLVVGAVIGGITAAERSSAGAPPTARAAGAAALAASAAGLSGLLDDLGEKAWNTRAARGRLGPAGRAGRCQGDDAAMPAPAAKGLRGHLGALAQGRLTTGAAKILGIGAGGAIASCVLHRGGRAPWTNRVVSTVVIAGGANLANLLDLRPGRALKAAVLATVPVVAAPGAAPVRVPAGAVLGAALAAAPGDLGERTMLGDTGANALGAGVAVAAACATALPARTLIAGGIVALTLAAEKVSFSAVIAATPGLRELDLLGRRR